MMRNLGQQRKLQHKKVLMRLCAKTILRKIAIAENAKYSVKSAPTLRFFYILLYSRHEEEITIYYYTLGGIA